MTEKSYHWYSARQREQIISTDRNNGRREHTCLCKLEDGSIREYTEATRKDEPAGKWDDYVRVGYGVFDHIEYRG
ncbi:MAG: hypothetical protein V3R78_10015 [Thermodesulfobacteriota bacterium]